MRGGERQKADEHQGICRTFSMPPTGRSECRPSSYSPYQKRHNSRNQASIIKYKKCSSRIKRQADFQENRRRNKLFDFLGNFFTAGRAAQNAEVRSFDQMIGIIWETMVLNQFSPKAQNINNFIHNEFGLGQFE
jgi:hypothetical protein